MYDEVLRLIHDEVFARQHSDQALTVIEFPRPKYDSAFLYYTLKALVSSAIVQIDAPLSVCTERNERRKDVLEARLAGASPDADVFADEPDLHYTPRQVYERYKQNATAAYDPSLVLALTPFRLYFRISNAQDDLGRYKLVSKQLVIDSILPLVKTEELLYRYYERREIALREFLELKSGVFRKLID